MSSGSFARHMRQTATLALAAAMLLSAAPALGDTVNTTGTPTPVAPSAPAKRSTASPSVRTPADTNSAIQAPVNQQTEAFRRALAEKQKRVDDFNAQLDALDRELEIASEAYNSACRSARRDAQQGPGRADRP